MKARFTPALCEYLEGQGFDIKIESMNDDPFPDSIKRSTNRIFISILNIKEKDVPDYIKEMLDLAKTECTNG